MSDDLMTEVALHRVAVASENADKRAAVFEACRIAFGTAAGVEGVPAPSTISQPQSDDETRQLAWERLGFAEKACPEADYWVGIESGLEEISGRTMVSSWVAVRHGGETVLCRSASFEIPQHWAMRLRDGGELGDLVQEEAGTHCSGGGAISLLTDDRIRRSDMLIQPLVAAFVSVSKPRRPYAP